MVLLEECWDMTDAEIADCVRNCGTSMDDYWEAQGKIEDASDYCRYALDSLQAAIKAN